MLSYNVRLWNDILINASLLLSTAFVIHWSFPRVSKLRNWEAGLVTGLLYGLSALVLARFPIGEAVSGKELAVGIAGVLNGPAAALLSLGMSLAGGWLEGGHSLASGYGSTITAACLGMLMYYAGRKTAVSPLGFACFGLLLSVEAWGWESIKLSDTADWHTTAYAAIPSAIIYILFTFMIRIGLLSQRSKGYIEEELRERENQYRTLVEHSQDLIFHCDVQGKLLSANRKFSEVTGLGTSELQEKSLDELLPFRSELAEWQQMLAQLLHTRLPVSAEKEIVNSEGIPRMYVTTLSPVIGAEEQIKSVIGTCYDITSIRKSEQHILQLSYFDTLTELPNRKLLLEKLQQAIASGSGPMVALVLIDLDNFKVINDTRGYPFGDELLKAVGNQLRQLFPAPYTVAKMGEDEYAILLEELDQIQPLLRCIETVQDQFQYPLFIRGEPIHTRTSMGVAVYPGDGGNAEELMRNAGTAIYKAKQSGKNQCCFYNADIRESMLRRSRLEDALRKALIHNEFILQFQPQCRAEPHAVRGFEALIRWVHPELGTISPAEFIPIAEETGAIVPIGEWVIRTACERIKAIQRHYFRHAIISVNVSSVQLARPDFVDMVIGILEETQLSPQDLELEITESILVASFDEAVRALERLRNHGVRIALDDFGTGYSSLSYLRRLPVETLKIDRSFIQDITTEPLQAALTESIIHLVHKMGIQVVAEGVETPEQLRYLQSWGCEYIQGYLLSEPLYELEIRRLTGLPQWRDPA
ncbi:putative bifunctional diguanylate cyclase/phosphodiesterase [Paenibacillus sp. TAB 01]|uniref:putative bifunctional diguanylate cyclase/phosphodiesterase n=1 Tax=Paenibacillus sp. TAB 01 TaxID=3368988 RepID=UPI003750B1D7